MGRVAKYKKIKAFDPFSKQNNGKGLDFIWGFGNNGAKVKKRSRTAEKLHEQKMARRLKRLNATTMNTANKKTLTGVDRSLNAPPSDIKDEFDLNNIQASIVPQKDDSHTLLLTEAIPTVSATTATTASDKPVQDTAAALIPKVHMDPDKEIKQAEKVLKLDDTQTPKFEGRREHESKNAYNNRVKSETRQIIQRQTRNALNPEKRQRKKEFLNNRKKKKKGKMQSRDNDDDDDDDGMPKQDYVPFGHQVERPPTFHSLPRGATAKKSGKADNNSNGNPKTKKSIQTQQDIQAEQDNLEKMRQKVQLQYAAIRAKRKQAFHL
jgi:hypothetical protein